MGVMPGDSVGEVEGAPPPPWHAPAHAPTAASVSPAVPAQIPADALAAVVARGEEADQQWRQETSELSGEWFRVCRPSPAPPVPTEEAGPDLLGALGRVQWECAALAMCALGPQFLGLLAVLLGGVMISRSRFWEIGDKVRALLGIPLAWFGLAVFWAWLRATELQQADASRERLAIAGHSLAHSWYLGPTLIGLGMALVLGYRLIRDARWS
jgi:hypothetical protein